MSSVDYLLPSMEVGSSRLPVTYTEAGTSIVHGKKIFRAGTFKDSTGTERTWTVEQLDTMVDNYWTLQQNHLLSGVPLRVDHNFSAKDLIGWISGLYRMGEFLYADLHFTEWEGFRKWDNGTYEPVSSEIAPYETNSGDIYFPTLIGVAFVDIPAVEGLYRASGVEGGRVTAVPIGNPMLDSSGGGVYKSGQEDHMSKHEAAFDKRLSGMSTAELVALSSHSAPSGELVSLLGLEGLTAEQITSLHSAALLEATPELAELVGLEGLTAEEITALANDAADEEDPEDEVVPELVGLEGLSTEEITALAAFAHPAATQAVAFRVNGVSLTDAALVQAHIDALETFRSGAIQDERKNFVTGLVRDNKILSTQAASLTDLALSMDANQFSKFRATYESSPGNPLLGVFGRDNGTDGNSPQNQSSVQEELKTVEEIVANHRRSGKDEEWIKNTASFKRMTEIKTQLQG